MARKPWESRFQSPEYREARAKNRHDNWSDRKERSRAYSFPQSYAYVEPMEHAVQIPLREFFSDRTATSEQKTNMIHQMLARIKKINFGLYRYDEGGLIVNFQTELQASAFRLMSPLRTQMIRRCKVNKDE
jgi:hypothetical protein